MSRIFLLLAVLAGLCGAANAGRNANGAMAVHVYTGGLEYTSSYNFCTDPEFDLPSGCQALATRSDDTPEEVTMIWLVAAFSPESSPGVTTLTIRDPTQSPAQSRLLRGVESLRSGLHRVARRWMAPARHLWEPGGLQHGRL